MNTDDPLMHPMLKVYPNPSKSILNIALPADLGEGVLEVHDYSGRKIAEYLVKHTSKIAIGDYDSGIYFVSLKSDKYVLQSRFMIE